jgi:energy-coupling factor transporter transmembrane protein EcfT
MEFLSKKSLFLADIRIVRQNHINPLGKRKSGGWSRKAHNHSLFLSIFIIVVGLSLTHIFRLYIVCCFATVFCGCILVFKKQKHLLVSSVVVVVVVVIIIMAATIAAAADSEEQNVFRAAYSSTTVGDIMRQDCNVITVTSTETPVDAFRVCICE